MSVAVQSDGKIVVSGTDYATQSISFLLARYNPNGTIDTTFGTSGNGTVSTQFSMGAMAHAMALQTDADGNTTNILVGGESGGQIALARYNLDGTLDASFGVGGKLQTPVGQTSSANALLVQPDGKLLLEGTADHDMLTVDSVTALARYAQQNTLTVVPVAGELSASASSSNEVDLAWTNNSAGAQVTIERSSATTADSDFSSIGTANAADGVFTDTAGLTAGTHYWYRLRTAGVSGPVYSNVVGVNTPSAAAPTIEGPGAGAPGALLLFKLKPQALPGINHWDIAWGDGSPIQSIAASGVSTGVYHSFAVAGDYVISATPSNGTTVYAPGSLAIAVVANASAAPGKNIVINFEPGYNVIPNGNLIDVGHVYSSRGDYYSYDTNYVYGWNLDMTKNAVIRKSSLSPAERYDTFISMQPDAGNHYWSIALPDGGYQVRIIAGDPSATNSNYQILANGVTVVSGVPTAAQHWFEGTVPVLVTDGKLTVTNGPGAVNNKIDYIEITPAQAAAASPTAPSNLTATAASPTAVDVRWTDNAAGESGFKVERSSNGGAWTQIGTTGPNAQAYFDSGLVANTTYSYRVRATNSIGDSAFATTPATSTTVAAATTLLRGGDAPYGRTTPWNIIDRIEAENFDTGGEGVAYHDDNSFNIGGQYRNTGVDIGANDYLSSPGYMVGWTHTGEWMNYTVNIAQSGSYRLDFRLASSGPGGQFSVRLDGQTVTGASSINIPDTGGWGSYVTLSQESVSLPAGTHVLQLYMKKIGVDGGVANCDWFQATLMSPTASTPVAASAPEALTAAPTTGASGGVRLTWQLPPSPSTVSGYVIHRSDNGGAFQALTPTSTLSASTTSYTDLTAPAGATCAYYLTSANGSAVDPIPSNLVTINVTAASSLVLAPTADASAMQAHPDTNSGAATTLIARGATGSGNADSHVYLKFDTSGFTGTIGKVVLRLFGRLDGSNQTGVLVDVKSVADVGWTESGLTWNTAAINSPAAAAALTPSTVNEGMGRWYEWDVIAYVQARRSASPSNLVVSLMLAPSVATIANLTFNSKEAAANAPVLIISPAVGYAAPMIDPVPAQTWQTNVSHNLITHFHEPDPNATDTVTIDWGDGNGPHAAVVNGSEIDASNTYTSTGPHTVTIYLSNNHGQSASTSFQVTVGDVVSGTISGLVWDDRNRDGGQNQGIYGPLEPGLGGWRVYVDLNGDGHYDAGDPNAQTALDGTYSITGLAPGSYTLRVDLLQGFSVVTPDGGSYQVDLSANDVVASKDFGVYDYINHVPEFDDGTAPPAALHLNPYGAAPTFAPPVAWTPGNVYAGTHFSVLEYLPGGALKQSLLDADGLGLPQGFAFNSTGMLYLVENHSPYVDTDNTFNQNNDGYGTLIRFGPSGNRLPDIPLAGSVAPTGLVFDANDNYIISGANKIVKYDPAGNVTDVWHPSKPAGFCDLAPDQHTLYYGYNIPSLDGSTTPSECGIVRMDLNTGDEQVVYRQFPPSGSSFSQYYPFRGVLAFRLVTYGPLAGKLLVARGQEAGVSVIDPAAADPLAAAIANYPNTGGSGSKGWSALNLDPDHKTFWTMEPDGTSLYHLDLETGALLSKSFVGGKYLHTIVVYGEPTAAAIQPNRVYAYNFHATDPDPGDVLTYSLVGDSNGATINPNTGALDGAPQVAKSYSFTVRVSDQLGAHSDFTFTVGVDHDFNGPNHAPSITRTPLSDAQANREYVNRVAATDPDNDHLTYTLLNTTDVSIDANTGIFHWLPTAADKANGSKTVTVQASDGQGGVDRHTFTIAVRPAAATNQAPVMAADVLYLTLPGGQQHAFQFWPVPTNYTPSTLGGADPYGGGLGIYQTYWIQFVCVDGSNATLTVQGDVHASVDHRISLVYDRLINEFYTVTDDGQELAYDPAQQDSTIPFGNNYTVRTADGTLSSIDATTGRLTSTQDPNGNVTSYDGASIKENGLTLKIERNGPEGSISKIYLADAQGNMVVTQSSTPTTPATAPTASR